MMILLKKTNYSKSKPIDSEAEMSTFSAGMVAVETLTQTNLLG